MIDSAGKLPEASEKIRELKVRLSHGLGEDAQHPTQDRRHHHYGRVKSLRAAPLEDYDDQPRGLWSRFKDRIGLGGEYDEEDDVIEFVDETQSKRRANMVRVRPTRINHVSVWLTVTSFDNAKQAADGLKEGHQQIVNLEKAAPEVTARVIDFLSGVTYALDGFIEKVGEKVYLFTPCNYVIDVENGASGSRKVQSPFHDN